MKIAPFTVEVLKNFSSINPSLYIKAGTVLETTNPTKTVRASARTETEFPRGFALYDVSKFISTLGMFKEAEVDFQDRMMTITNGGGARKTNLMYSVDSLVERVPEKKPQIDKPDAEATITADNLADVEKALKVLGVEDVVVCSEGDSIYLKVMAVQNPSTDMHTINLGNYGGRPFKAVFRAELLTLLPDDYQVHINKRGFARFTSERMEYFVAVESELSSFQ
jgi:gp45 sliding clamp, C terminal